MLIREVASDLCACMHDVILRMCTFDFVFLVLPRIVVLWLVPWLVCVFLLWLSAIVFSADPDLMVTGWHGMYVMFHWFSVYMYSTSSAGMIGHEGMHEGTPLLRLHPIPPS